MRTALIADSNSRENTLIRNTLIELGFERIRECRDGRMAVDTALNELPDVAVIDSSLPVYDGMTTAGMILKHLRIPIIIVGPTCSAETARQAATSGIASFLSKPLRDQELMSAVEISLSWMRERQDLYDRIEKLSDAVETRKAVDRAKGLLMERERLSETDAYRKLQRTAMNRQTSLKNIAEEVIRRFR